MKFKQITLQDAPEPFDVVVVIDVIRAFTCAAYALARGARRIYLVSTVEEALSLRDRNPGWRLMGETGGLPIASFDYWNSPTEIDRADLAGVTLVHRTTAGTQGVIMWQNAAYKCPAIFTASFAVANATADAVRALKPEYVGFVVTGVRPDVPGTEDIACASYLQALLEDKKVSPDPYLQKARVWNPGNRPFSPERLRQIWEDFEYCMRVDTFDFPMQVHQQNGLMYLEGRG